MKNPVPLSGGHRVTNFKAKLPDPSPLATVLHLAQRSPSWAHRPEHRAMLFAILQRHTSTLHTR